MSDFNDDTPALQYIKDRGYASYSSVKNVRDCEVPTKSDAAWFVEGGETHSLWLEGTRDKERSKLLTEGQEARIKEMVRCLNKHSVAMKLHGGLKSKTVRKEREITTLLKPKWNTKYPLQIPTLWGLHFLGYLDIEAAPLYVSDLKTTKCKNKKAFADSMDFLQAAFYLRATGAKDFYYIGICKEAPHEIFIFNVWEYRNRMLEAHREMERLCKYIVKRLKTL